MNIESKIESVTIIPLEIYKDDRGWLLECFRNDEIKDINRSIPQMSYFSFTKYNEIRGPHEHKIQTDLMIFAGPGDFELYLWDNKYFSKTKGNHQKLIVGESNPLKIIIPPNIVHGIKSVSEPGSYFINCPNRLYKGLRKEWPADEIRYENNPDSPFKIL